MISSPSLRPRTVAGDLSIPAATLAPTSSCGAARAMLATNPAFPGVAIVADGTVHGYIDRLTLLNKLALPIHHDLFERRAVTLLMDAAPLLVDHATDIDELADQLTREKPEALTAGFVVTRDGRYLGIATAL